MYIRMISKKAKWEQDKLKNIDEMSSDIITNCLKTSKETLSLWYIEDESEIDSAIIALSSNRETTSRLDYIIIEDDFLNKYNLKIEKSTGNSPYTGFNENHFDIINLNYGLLGKVSEMIFEIIKNGNEIVRVSEKDVLSKLKNAYAQGLLDTKLIKEPLLSKINIQAS